MLDFSSQATWFQGLLGLALGIVVGAKALSYIVNDQWGKLITLALVAAVAAWMIFDFDGFRRALSFLIPSVAPAEG